MSSHIVPEFLYEALYDEKHRFIELSLKHDEHERFKQKGLREPLLCALCEQKLSVYENYMRKLLRGGVAVVAESNGEHLRLAGVDYRKLKLFQLSVLWRASVSTLRAFSQVNLGPHEDLIRGMLQRDEPGDAHEYGCIVSTLMNEREVLQGLHVAPTTADLVGHPAYRFVFGGLVFVYVITRDPLPEYLVHAFAQPDGSALIRRQQIKEMGFLLNAFQELKNQGKLEADQ